MLASEFVSRTTQQWKPHHGSYAPRAVIFRHLSPTRHQPATNMSIDTDPQQQAAAPPLMLVVRSFLR